MSPPPPSANGNVNNGAAMLRSMKDRRDSTPFSFFKGVLGAVLVLLCVEYILMLTDEQLVGAPTQDSDAAPLVFHAEKGQANGTTQTENLQQLTNYVDKLAFFWCEKVIQEHSSYSLQPKVEPADQDLIDLDLPKHHLMKWLAFDCPSLLGMSVIDKGNTPRLKGLPLDTNNNAAAFKQTTTEEEKNAGSKQRTIHVKPDEMAVIHGAQAPLLKDNRSQHKTPQGVVIQRHVSTSQKNTEGAVPTAQNGGKKTAVQEVQSSLTKADRFDPDWCNVVANKYNIRPGRPGRPLGAVPSDIVEAWSRFECDDISHAFSLGLRVPFGWLHNLKEKNPDEYKRQWLHKVDSTIKQHCQQIFQRFKINVNQALAGDLGRKAPPSTRNQMVALKCAERLAASGSPWRPGLGRPPAPLPRPAAAPAPAPAPTAPPTPPPPSPADLAAARKALRESLLATEPAACAPGAPPLGERPWVAIVVPAAAPQGAWAGPPPPPPDGGKGEGGEGGNGTTASWGAWEDSALFTALLPSLLRGAAGAEACAYNYRVLAGFPARERAYWLGEEGEGERGPAAGGGGGGAPSRASLWFQAKVAGPLARAAGVAAELRLVPLAEGAAARAGAGAAAARRLARAAAAGGGAAFVLVANDDTTFEGPFAGALVAALAPGGGGTGGEGRGVRGAGAAAGAATAEGAVAAPLGAAAQGGGRGWGRGEDGARLLVALAGPRHLGAFGEGGLFPAELDAAGCAAANAWLAQVHGPARTRLAPSVRVRHHPELYGPRCAPGPSQEAAAKAAKAAKAAAAAAANNRTAERGPISDTGLLRAPTGPTSPGAAAAEVAAAAVEAAAEAARVLEAALARSQRALAAHDGRSSSSLSGGKPPLAQQPSSPRS